MAEKTALRATPAKGVTGQIDREKGIIHGIALTTEGEAKGHGVFLDSEFVQATVDNTNSLKLGLKSRFGHPNMSSSAIGSFLGRIKNAKFDDSSGVAVARGDLHLSEASKKSPNGDLYNYVLDLAEDAPDQFGTSIVFIRGNTYKRDEKGNKVLRRNSDGTYNDTYDSIDSKIYQAQKKLLADDVVDTPAANPSGLFSEFSSEQPAAIVTQFLDENPEIWEMLQDSDVENIFESFKERYEAYKADNFDIAGVEPVNSQTTKTAPAENKKESNKMDLTKLKAEHPAVFQAVLDEGTQLGVSKERKRVNAHLKIGSSYNAMDIAIDAVKNGSDFFDAEVQAEYMIAGRNKEDIETRDDDDKKLGAGTDDTNEEPLSAKDAEDEEIDNFVTEGLK